MRTSSRTPLLAGTLCCLLGLVVTGCSGRGRDVPGGDGTEGDMSEPPSPSCEKDNLRCSPDNKNIEVCNGKRWVVQKGCDTTVGEVCRGGNRCAGPCEDLPSGSAGCSFYPGNFWSTSTLGQLGIVAANTSNEISAQVTLSDKNGTIETKTAAPGGLVVFRVDHNRNKLDRTELAKKGFHLASSAPVAAYLFHPIDAAQVFSGSATLMLPEHVMAKNYFAVSYTYNSSLPTTPAQGQGLLAVIGMADNTQVEVTVPVATMAGTGVKALARGETLTTTINRLDVLEIIQSNTMEDISGATVKSSAPVAVYGGAGAVSIPKTAVGGNHLGVQMYPLTTWGKRYVGTKFKQRNATDHDYYRILASIDNTTVTFTGSGATLPSPQTINRGAFFEFDTDADFEITADHPILAFQYMPAWGNLSGTFSASDFPNGAPPGCPYAANSVQCLGDANMAPLVPVEQYRSDYLFYVPETYHYNFVNVIAPLGTALQLDGKSVSEPLRPLGNGTLGRAILTVKAGNHRITGDMPFGLMSYGYAWATSYSYPGGLNLEMINPNPPG